MTLLSWARSFSQLDPPLQPASSAALGTSAYPAAPARRARLQPPPPAQFPYPSLINDPVTARIRQYSLEDQADASGLWSSIPESFEQLRSDLTNHNFLATLGNYAVDDPSKLDRLALANLRENKPSLLLFRCCLPSSGPPEIFTWHLLPIPPPSLPFHVRFPPHTMALPMCCGPGAHLPHTALLIMLI